MNIFTTEFETIALTKPADHIALVTLNRPQVRNALNTAMMTEIRDIFQALYVSNQGLRTIIITGAGDKAFCAGGDLKQRNSMTDAQWQQQHAILEQAALAILECPLPLIAAVNGDCMGGGLEVAMCCDFIYAAAPARFAMPEGKLGIMPGAAGTQNLPRAVGVRRAKELIMTGRIFSADQAQAWNLVNEVLPADQLIERVVAVGNEIATLAPLSVEQIKKCTSIADQVDLKTGYSFEITAYNRLVPTQDRLEGIAAFNEKRKPDFNGN